MYDFSFAAAPRISEKGGRGVAVCHFSLMKIQLSDHFTYRRLFRFTIPSIFMMIFTSLYGVVDGFFVSNFVGKEQFAAINLIMPFIMVLSSVGFMLGSGGSALVAFTLGEGERKKADEIFSLVTYTCLILGACFSIIGAIFCPAVAKGFGASDEMLPYCVTYARISFISLPFYMVMNGFQSFFITAQKPKLGLYVTIASGCTNMVGDALLMGVFRLGVGSAAAATAASEIVGGVLPIVYFSHKNSSLLKLGRTRFMGRALIKSATNGASEFLSNIAGSIAAILYNYQLMRYYGSDGVSAYGIIMYTNFIFVGVFFGYAMGSSPITGYNLGREDYRELKNVFWKSIKITVISSVVMSAAYILLSRPLAFVFAGYDRTLLDLTAHAIRIYSLSYVFLGINIYASAFFTSMNDGFASAVISLARTLVFQTLCIIVLPILFGIEGIWFAALVSNAMAFIVSLFFLIRDRNKYHYV